MGFIPIRISSIEVLIHASRQMVFQSLIAFGAETPGSEPVSRVLSQDKGRLLVEFETPIPLLFEKRKMFRTVEWVTPREPEMVEFEEAEGPFAMRRERLILEEEGESTRLKYEAEFGMHGWVLGWLLGVLFIRRKLGHAVQEHMCILKETNEAQAQRSSSVP